MEAKRTKTIIAILSVTVIFIVFKLMGLFTVSWLWVLAPLWLPPVLVFGFFGVAALMAGAFGI